MPYWSFLYFCTIFLGTKLRAHHEGAVNWGTVSKVNLRPLYFRKVKRLMGNDMNGSMNLEQELAQKASELEMQRSERKETLVDITLRAIANAVQSQASTIDTMTNAAGKALPSQTLRLIVVNEIVRAAADRLWCDHYSERAKSDQQVNAYVGTHWERIDSQLWMDFIDECAERCGLAESLRKTPSFMNPLYESVAFNLKKHRRKPHRSDEVLLNFPNGTLVVKKDGTVELREHNRDDLFFYCLGYCYDPNAEYIRWQQFLDRVLPDPQAQLLFAEYLGYCLMSDHRFEKLLWLYGPGQNGKSTALTVIEWLFGSENISYLSLENLTNDEKKLALFEHKLLNISSETGRNINASVMKQIASGETLTVEQKYLNPRLITDYGKVITATNQMPKSENTFAFFRRFVILPFDQTITEQEKDVHLAEKLKTELAGILNWIIEALIGLMSRQAFTSCESSERALEQYKLESDNVMLFRKEMLETSEEPTKAIELFKAYKDFCKASEFYAVGKGIFYKRLDALTHSRIDIGNVPYFKLKLIES